MEWDSGKQGGMEEVSEVLTVRLLIYLIMALAFMTSALVSCDLIKTRPDDNRPWLIAAPSLILTIMLLAVMFDDLLS